MTQFTNISDPVLAQSKLPEIVERFRQKSLSYSLVRDAVLKIDIIEGAKVSDSLFVFATSGELYIKPFGLPNLRLKFSATGDYKREERRVYLTNLKVLNDMAGIANKMLDATDIAVGRSLHIDGHDDELITSLFPSAVA